MLHEARGILEMAKTQELSIKACCNRDKQKIHTIEIQLFYSKLYNFPNARKILLVFVV